MEESESTEIVKEVLRFRGRRQIVNLENVCVSTI